MIIYILRHGTTEWNARHLIQGQTDIPLDDFGKQMARETGLGLVKKGIKFDRIYSSPLKRAYETASIINNEYSRMDISDYTDNARTNSAPLNIITDDRLKELGFGFMDGGKVEVMSSDVNCPFRYFKSAPDLYENELLTIRSDGSDNCPELLSELCDRAKSFMQEVIEPLALDEYMSPNTSGNISSATSAVSPGSAEDIPANPIETVSEDRTIPTDRTVLISAHGALSKALLMHICNNSDLSTFWGEGLLPNCGMAIVSLTYAEGNYDYKVINPSVIFYSDDISKNAPKLL